MNLERRMEKLRAGQAEDMEQRIKEGEAKR